MWYWKSSNYITKNIFQGESISSGSASTPSTEMSPPSTVLDITQTGSTVSGSASSSASPEDISPDLSRMQLRDPVKFQGDAGKSFNVTSNYLKIVATPNTGVYEYDVRFNPNVDSRQDRFRLIRQIEPTIGTIRVSYCFLIKFLRLHICVN